MTSQGSVLALGLSRFQAMEQPAKANAASWEAMLGEGEREASNEEVAALDAKYGLIQACGGEG